jgi:hypothetical protein
MKATNPSQRPTCIAWPVQTVLLVLLATLLDTELGNGRVRGRAREECVLLLLLAIGNTRHLAAVALGCTTACTLLLR